MTLKEKVEKAIIDLKTGIPIMLFDYANRENETDLIYYGPFVDSKAVYDLRINAGAPLSVYIDYETSIEIGITIFSTMVRSLKTEDYKVMHELVKPTGTTDPRFSLTFDYRENFTGCSHFETARTIQMLSGMIENRKCKEFAKTFRSPGHIPLIISSQNLLKDRNGHSELIMTLIKKEGLLPFVVASEILDSYSGHSLGYEQAISFAKFNNLVFLEGKEIEQL